MRKRGGGWGQLDILSYAYLPVAKSGMAVLAEHLRTRHDMSTITLFQPVSYAHWRFWGQSERQAPSLPAQRELRDITGWRQIMSSFRVATVLTEIVGYLGGMGTSVGRVVGMDERGVSWVSIVAAYVGRLRW